MRHIHLAAVIAAALPMSLWFHVSAARALPEGYGLDATRAVRYHGFTDLAGRAGSPAVLPEPGWAVVPVDQGLECRRTAPVGTTPAVPPGPYISGSLYEELGRPDRIIHAAPGVATSPVHVLLKVNPSYSIERFSNGIGVFDCETGMLERRGIFFPTSLGGREVLIDNDIVVNGLALGPALQHTSDATGDHIVARITDRTQHPDFPYAHPFNHLVRWPLSGTASEPEVLVSTRALVDSLMTERERAIFGRYLGWSLRIQSFLPLADGSIWFVVDLDNDRSSRDVVPRSVLFRRDPDGTLLQVHTVRNAPNTTGSGPSRLAMERLVKPGPEPILVVGTAGVVSTEAPYRFTWTPPGSLVMQVFAGYDGPWGITSDVAMAPVVFDPNLADFDGDLMRYTTENTLGTSDLAFDTDGDGFHDRREHLDSALDALVPGEPIATPHTRWGISTRIQTAWFAKPDTTAWDTTPYFDGYDADGGDAPAEAARYTPEGLPAQTTAWALKETLGVAATGFETQGTSAPFVAAWPTDAVPLHLDTVTGPVNYLGPDDTHGAAFVHIPRTDRFPVFRLFPDQQLEFLFDASWYGLDAITSMQALSEHDSVLASIGGAYGSAENRRFVVFDAGFNPWSVDQQLSASHSRIARFFGIGYGVADQLEPFAGGYATQWIGELVAVDDRVRPGDIVSPGDGLFVVREDLAVHRWLKPEDLLALAQGAAKDALLARWDELLHREVVPPLDMFPVHELAIADDASRIALVGDGRVWELALSEGRATSLNLPVTAGALGVAYLGNTLVTLHGAGGMLSVENMAGDILAETPVDANAEPWRLARFGPVASPTWVVFHRNGTAQCLGHDGGLRNNIANAVMSPFTEDAVIWMQDHRIVAGSVSDFCTGTFVEHVDRYEADEVAGTIFDTQRAFWQEIARKSWRFSSGGSAAYRVEMLPVTTADMAVRPDGGVLVSVREVDTGWEDILTNPLGGTPFFLGAFRPTDGAQQGVPAHAPYRQAIRGIRIGVPITSRQAPFVSNGPMARVPGPVPSDWGHMADMRFAGRTRPDPWTPPPTPEPEPEPEPEPGPDAPGDDGGCGGGPAAPVWAALLAVAYVVLVRRRRGSA